MLNEWCCIKRGNPDDCQRPATRALSRRECVWGEGGETGEQRDTETEAHRAIDGIVGPPVADKRGGGRELFSESFPQTTSSA